MNSISGMAPGLRSSSALNSHRFRDLAIGFGLFCTLALAGRWMPGWLTFLLTMAAGNGLVSLGIQCLMRAGVVSFGQGMAFAVGGYGAVLLFTRAGWTDALGLSLAGGLLAVLLAAPFAPLLARYRGIFFATLTLAMSMVLYGVLVKWTALGGSDGVTVARPSLFGQQLAGDTGNYVMYLLAIAITLAIGLAMKTHFASSHGLISLAVRDNELRIEYLGASVHRVMALNFLLAAFCGGVGGAIVTLALGHVDPNFSYWTTSGEFVFVAILAGHQSVAAVFVASTLLEVVRSFSSAYFPNTWQLVLGFFLLTVIRFLPRGIGSLWKKEEA